MDKNKKIFAVGALFFVAVIVASLVVWDPFRSKEMQDFVSRKSVVEKVRKQPGTLTPGIHLEGKRGTVEIISVDLMTGREWKERIKSYEGMGQVHKPANNERLWVINYTCRARSVGLKLGEYHRVLLWKAFDARTGDFEYFHAKSP